MTVSILIFLPVVAALAVLLFKNEAAKHAALTFSVLELAVAGLFLTKFVPNALVQFAIDVPWIPKMGVYFSAGIDGAFGVPESRRSLCRSLRISEAC